MTERQALKAFNAAQDAHSRAPSYATASALYARAVDLVEISDDYVALMDEADDEMVEAEFA